MFPFSPISKFMKLAQPCNFIHQNIKNGLPKVVTRFEVIFEKSPELCKKLETSEIPEQEWPSIREEFLRSNTGINEKSVDSIIMDICVTANNNKSAKAYFEFLRNNNYPINLMTNRKYLGLFKNEVLAKEEEEKILDTCQQMKKYPLLDEKSMENYIMGLCMTKNWREVHKIVDEDGVSVNAVWYWVGAAFKNAEYDVGWKYMMKNMTRTEYIPTETHVDYFTSCGMNFEGRELEAALGKYLHFLNSHYTIFAEKVLESVTSTFSKIRWQSHPVRITSNGTCPCCNVKLKSPTLSAEDYKTLSLSFMKKIIIGDDIYENSSPAELDHFKRFVMNTAPYDVVIDGLNVSYSTAHASKRHKVLELLVDHLIENKKKVFIFGRAHMKKWSRMQIISKKATCYFADNLTKDDPYMLYAALYSGPNTKFISMDFMRQHLSSLEDLKLKKLFKDWQLINQLQVKHADPERKKIHIDKLSPFQSAPQEDANGWHIPYTTHQQLTLPTMMYTFEWICLRKTN